jgi:predicted nucleic acid-binding protein
VKPALLDLNLLIALLWPSHEHHEAAHRWFGGRRKGRWATCALTQLGFIRLVSNPAFSRDALSPADAILLLSANLAHPNHVF